MAPFVRWFKKKNDYEDIEEPEQNGGSHNNESVSYFSLYRHASSLDIFYMFIGIVCTFIVAVCQPIYIILFGEACSSFIGYTIGISTSSVTIAEKKTYENILQEEIFNYAIAITTIGVGTLILRYIGGVLWLKSSSRQVLQRRRQFLEKLLYQDICWFDVNRDENLFTQFSDYLTKIEEGVGEKIPLLLYHEMVFLSGIITSVFMGYKLTLVCIISLPASLLVTAAVSKLTRKYSVVEMESYASASAVVDEVFSAIKTVVAFGGQNKEIKRFEDQLNKSKNNNTKKILFNSIGEGILFFFMYSCCGLAAWYGMHLIVEGRSLHSSAEMYNVGNIIAIIYMTWIACWNFYMAIPLLQVFGIACEAAKRIEAVSSNGPKINISMKYGLRLIKCMGQLSFSKVHFNYPSQPSISILNGFSFTVDPGETVGLVGLANCGGITCFQLLQRFYDPTYGKIVVNGIDLKDLNLSWWRNQIGVVENKPTLFCATVSENIRCGNLMASYEEIEKAARKAQIHRIIRKLPHGYNTIIDDSGVLLSAEHKWRLCLARAIVKKPTFLLIDATSVFRNSRQVRAIIDSVSKDYTCIILADRFHTVKSANRIYIVSEGQIENHGTYHDLMDDPNIFYPNFKAQPEEISKDSEVSENTQSGDVTPKTKGEIHETQHSSVGIFDLLKLTTPEWPLIAIGSFCSTIIGASMPMSTLLLADVIGNIYILNSDELVSLTEPLCWHLIFLGMISGLAYLLQNWAFGVAGEKLSFRLRRQMFSSMIDQETNWFDKKENSIADLSEMLFGNTTAVSMASGMLIGLFFNSATNILISNIISFSSQMDLALILELFIPVILLVSFCESRSNLMNTKSKEEMLKVTNKYANEAINKIRTVASLGREDVFLVRYTDEIEYYIRSTRGSSYLRVLFRSISRSLMAFAYSIGLLYGVMLIISEGVTYKTIVKVSELQISGAWAVSQAFAFLPNIYYGLEATNKVLGILKRIPEIRSMPHAFRGPFKSGTLKLSNVHFLNPSKPQQQILKGLALEVAAGKTVAVVGSKGSGSIIIQLLERFYDVNDGEITIDDVNISIVDLKYLRKSFAVVFQESSFFDSTITENIAYGDNDKVVSPAEIVRAARIANIHDLIISLPLGYETRVGFKGCLLSRSQKQRLAIARALVRNPKVLLLDNPTTALNHENAETVRDAFIKAKRNRTCLITSQDPKIIQNADIICFFHKGKIVEAGSHDELIRKEGYYYDSYMAQSIFWG